jgi:hypothetical protein
MDKRSLTPIITMLLIMAFGLQVVHAQPFTDPTGDVFDANGKLIEAEPYLDIVSVDLKKSDANYVFELGVNGALPRSIDPSLWIEWDVLIDFDNNASTGWSWPLVFNDLGVDYVIRVGMLNSTYYPEVRETATWKFLGAPSCQISGSKITFAVPASSAVRFPSTLSWMAAVRKYGEKGAPKAPLLAADKAPNTGHCTTAIETIRTETTVTALQEGNWTVLSDGSFDLIGEHGEMPGDLGQPYVDLTSFGYGLFNESLYFRFILRDKIPNEPTNSRVDSIWYQVLFDVDSDSSTGFHWSKDFTPDYILQLYVKFDALSKTANASSFILKYTGNGSDWDWTEIESTQRLGKDATLAGGIGQDFFVLTCKYQDISAPIGSTIRFFGRSGTLYAGHVYNDYVPDWGQIGTTVTLVLIPAIQSATETTAKTTATATTFSEAGISGQIPGGYLTILGVVLAAMVVIAVAFLVRRQKLNRERTGRS